MLPNWSYIFLNLELFLNTFIIDLQNDSFAQVLSFGVLLKILKRNYLDLCIWLEGFHNGRGFSWRFWILRFLNLLLLKRNNGIMEFYIDFNKTANSETRFGFMVLYMSKTALAPVRMHATNGKLFSKLFMSFLSLYLLSENLFDRKLVLI